MKKITVILVVLFSLSALLFSQAIQYDIKVRYTRLGNADITVMVKVGEGNFTYFLMTNDPMKGEVIMKSEPTRSKTYVFKDVKPGKYFVKIEDRQGLPAGRTVEIKENEN
jgi:hypothetical protein